MATTYTTLLKLAKPTQGELDGSWGTVVNDNITSMIEEAIAGRSVINSWSGNSATLSTANGTTAESRSAMLSLTDTGDQLGSNAATVVCPALSKVYIVKNAVGQNATLKTASGTGVIIPNGKTMLLYCDGTNVVEGVDHIAGAMTTGSTIVSTGDITAGGTVGATGDTAAGDDAALGYTSAEGLILTGQGSTSDITIKNDADAAVLTVATGTTNVDIVGDVTASTVNADGDTAAGDYAAMGYTSAEGLILTGQGSTNDITIKNDADAIVLAVATGTTNVDIVGDATAATFKPDGDTASNDTAAIGYTSAEGLILTGQGSTNDVTIKNDADAEVMGVLTGTTTAAFTGQVTGTGFTGTLDGILGSGTPAAATVTTMDASGVATATTFEPDGDTSAGDNAAIGYTSAEGLILTGQGSTNDVTIKNDADADVLEIPTGTTNVTVVGNITAGGTLGASGDITATGGTLIATGDTAAGDDAAMGYTSAEGLILTGQGSTNDVTIKNDADAAVISIPTGTTNVTIAGDLTISGDDLTMGTNTSGAILVADGTNYNPAVVSGDISISTSGVAAIGAGVIVEADIADNAVTLAKMASGTDGNIISYDASGNPVAIATGNDGQVLTSTGAGSPPAFEDAAGGGAWTLIGRQTASGSSSITQTGIDGTYDIYALTLIDMVPATNNVDPRMRFGTSGGILSAGGYVYRSGWEGSAAGTAQNDWAGNGNDGTTASNGEDRIDISHADTWGTSNISGFSFNCLAYLFKPYGGTGRMAAHFNWHNMSDTGNRYYMGNTFVRRGAVENITQVQFYYESGNIATGVMTLWGIKHT